jgi:hypothetical protein
MLQIMTGRVGRNSVKAPCIDVVQFLLYQSKLSSRVSENDNCWGIKTLSIIFFFITKTITSL